MSNTLTRGVAIVGGLTIGDAQITEAELELFDGLTAGTVTASKAVVVDANKDIGDFRNLDAVNFDAGASGTAGSVDIFPTTAASGKLTLACADQTGDTTVTVQADAMGQASTVHLADPGAAASYLLQSTAAITLAEADVLDAVTAGTVTASKAVVVDASKDIGDFNNLDVVNLDAGASGTAGSIDIFPTTAASGKLALTCADQTGDTTVTVQADAMGQASTVHLADPGAAASYLLQSTAAVTLAEADVLDGAVAGTLTASKAVIVDANSHLDALHATTLGAGKSGTSGTLELYPTTAASGKTSYVTQDNVGDTNTTISVDAQAAGRTYHIPDAGADAYFVQSTAAVTLAEADVLDGATAGTVVASKAVVVDASKDIGDFNNLDVVNLDAGASGTAGSVDIFPTTAASGKLTLACADQTGDTVVTVQADAMGQASTVHLADPGAAASYLLQSTAAITLAEADVLDGVAAGTASASKAVVLDGSLNVTGVNLLDVATLTNATLILESLNPLTIKLNDTNALQLDNAAIAAFAAAADTAGTIVYGETQDGGADSAVDGANAGGSFQFKMGDAGAAGADMDGAAGGTFTFTTGAGSAGGAHTANNPDGGAGGDFTIVLSTGGAAGGGGGGAAGRNGQFILTNLPTGDPTVAGAVWSNAGILTISAG